jgi:hypothetical protein
MPTATLDMNGWIDEEDDGTYTVTVRVTGLPNDDIAEAVSFWLRDLVKESSGKTDGPITFQRDA